MASLASVSRNALMSGALAALVVQGPPAAFAQGERAAHPGPRVIDGQPTPEACARYGYAIRSEYEDGASQAGLAVTGARIPQPNVSPPAIAAPPPAPPAPPPPPSQSAHGPSLRDML